MYSECPSYDDLIPALLSHPLEELPQRVHFKPGVPVKPMLAKPTTGASRGQRHGRKERVRRGEMLAVVGALESCALTSSAADPVCQDVHLYASGRVSVCLWVAGRLGAGVGEVLNRSTKHK